MGQSRQMIFIETNKIFVLQCWNRGQTIRITLNPTLTHDYKWFRKYQTLQYLFEKSEGKKRIMRHDLNRRRLFFVRLLFKSIYGKSFKQLIQKIHQYHKIQAGLAGTKALYLPNPIFWTKTFTQWHQDYLPNIFSVLPRLGSRAVLRCWHPKKI